MFRSPQVGVPVFVGLFTLYVVSSRDRSQDREETKNRHLFITKFVDRPPANRFYIQLKRRFTNIFCKEEDPTLKYLQTLDDIIPYASPTVRYLPCVRNLLWATTWCSTGHRCRPLQGTVLRANSQNVRWSEVFSRSTLQTDGPPTFHRGRGFGRGRSGRELGKGLSGIPTVGGSTTPGLA